MLTVILSGGESRRMGRDKAMLRFGGGTMLSALIERYGVLGNVAVSVNRAGRFPFAGAAELIDSYPGKGPLNGIISAFQKTDENIIFLTATDLPNGDASLASELIRRLGGSPSVSLGGSQTASDGGSQTVSDGGAVRRTGLFDACVIGTRERCDPLFGAYTRACLAPAVECILGGRLSFYSLLGKIAVNYIDPSELASWDLPRILFNVNTPEEYSEIAGE